MGPRAPCDGADASIDLERFDVSPVVDTAWPQAREQANAWLALAACVPQAQGLDPARSWYRLFTRFGRHGDVGALSAHPFKAPILLTRSGAVFTPKEAFSTRVFIGSGLGGGQDNNVLSKFMPGTVHQGYAPVVGICLDEPKEAPS